MKKLLVFLALVIAAGFTGCEDTNNPPDGKDTYTISFNNTGGSGGQTATVTATFGQAMPALTAQAPTKNGSIFDGYFDAQSGGKKYYNVNLSSAANWDKKADATLYAQWTQIPSGSSAVSFNANGGSGGQTETVTAVLNQPMPALSAGAPVNEGNTGAYPADYYKAYRCGTTSNPLIDLYTMSFLNNSENYFVKKYFDGYWDAQTGGKKYYNADLSSAASWDKTESSITLYARWLTVEQKYNITLGNDDFVAYFVDTPPTIDGNGNDLVWAKARWQPMKYQWMYEGSLSAASNAADFSGRFKIVWTADRLYILAEIIDDTISVTRNVEFGTGFDNAHEDDCLEMFIDENASGGTRTSDGGNNFFAYHMGYRDNNHFAADFIGSANNNSNDLALRIQGGLILRNVHLNYAINKNRTTYTDTWETEMKVYDNTYPLNKTPGMPSSNNPTAAPTESELPPVTLTDGKKMGLAVAYCDSDNGSRNHFFGSMAVTGSNDGNRNQSYLNSSGYAKIYLVK